MVNQPHQAPDRIFILSGFFFVPRETFFFEVFIFYIEFTGIVIVENRKNIC